VSYTRCPNLREPSFRVHADASEEHAYRHDIGAFSDHHRLPFAGAVLGRS
jgi:hypothetical protein